MNNTGTDIRRLFDKPAKYIFAKYADIKKKEGADILAGDNLKKLELLNPGKSGKRLAADYYCGKIADVMLAGTAAVFIMAAVWLSRQVQKDPVKDYRLMRHGVGEGDYSMELNAGTDEHDYGSITIDVKERLLSDEECDELMDQLYTELMQEILSDNESLSHVDKDMYFPTVEEGYPFTLRWESSDYAAVDSSGHVDATGIGDDGFPVDIKLYMTYRGREREYDYKAVIYPIKPEGDELLLQKLKELMDNENSDSADKEYYKLPEYIDGRQIKWASLKQPVIPLLAVMTVCILLGIWFGSDRDLRRRYEVRNRELMIEYSDFISSLQLMLSSGQTIRRALERMVADYKRDRAKGGAVIYVYEELALCTKKLGDGMSEAECYEYFGRRCNIVCYRKLSALLVQNLRKGNDGLIEAMDNEVHIAFEERKAVARRLGEEARTKLILPMMLMLSVVMIIIMIPAYLSFGGM